MADELTILRAGVLHTHDRDQAGDAVAIRDGRIEAVGGFAELQEAHPAAAVDDRYGDLTVMPGFVEAHSHASAGQWRFPYLGYFDATGPDGRRWTGCTSIDQVLDRLREADAAMADPSEPLTAWGLDPIYYPGERLIATHLDQVSTTRPICVFHASLHLCTVNTALMEQAGIGPDTLTDGVPKDGSGWPIGELQEPAAMALAGDAMMAFWRAAMGAEGKWDYGRLANRSGITTLVDLGSTSFEADAGAESWHQVVDDPDYPARLALFHGAGQMPDDAAAVELIHQRAAESTDKLRFAGVKFVLDGSIQGFTARLSEPYLGDRPNGLWLIPPEQVPGRMRPYLEAGILTHVHTNGDQAVELLLDSMRENRDVLRPDHRTTAQHSQLTRPEQYEAMAELGMTANIFSNHIWYWGDQHVEITVGPERAARMNSAATVLRAGVPLSMHCDSPVTPLGSLHVAWCAVNRQTPSGRILGPDERISVSEAMLALTRGAAYQLKMDDEIGSITPGKRADFAVLDADPHTIDPMELRDIGVAATVVGGVHHPVS